MAKSKRSKVKMAYKAMRRAVLEPKRDAQLREQAAKVYEAIGLEMPTERTEGEQMPSRSHGGSELVTTFTPTPKGPKLNVVHGPNAVDDSLMRLPRQVVSLPMLGSAARARRQAGRPVRNKVQKMDVDAEDFEKVEERPFLYPRRARKSGGIKKGRRKSGENVPRQAKKKARVKVAA